MWSLTLAPIGHGQATHVETMACLSDTQAVGVTPSEVDKQWLLQRRKTSVAGSSITVLWGITSIDKQGNGKPSSIPRWIVSAKWICQPDSSFLLLLPYLMVSTGHFTFSWPPEGCLYIYKRVSYLTVTSFQDFISYIFFFFFFEGVSYWCMSAQHMMGAVMFPNFAASAAMNWLSKCNVMNISSSLSHLNPELYGKVLPMHNNDQHCQM